MNPTIQRFNRLVEEFDESTRYQFDRVTDATALVVIANLWPGCRRGLGTDLLLAADLVRLAGQIDHCQECGEVCPKGWRLCPECHTRRDPKDAGRDDWRADR